MTHSKQMTALTPYCPAHVQALMHWRCCPERASNEDSPVVTDFARTCLEEGVIKPSPNGNYYETTELGTAWVNAICAVPLPTVVFIDSHGRVIKP